jgi:hypothetical protein
MEVRGITLRVGGPFDEGRADNSTISGEEAEPWSCGCDRIGMVKSYMERPSAYRTPVDGHV